MDIKYLMFTEHLLFLGSALRLYTYDLNEFPLNLLPEINQLATAELMFLLIILNIFIVKYITSLDYNKYIPNNKIGIFIDFAIKRYIKVWKISSKFLFSLAWFLLVFNIFMTKIAIYHIIN